MANESKATLILELKDLVSSGLNKIGNGVENFGKQLEQSKFAFIGAFGALTAGIGIAIKGFAEQEQAVNKLSLALANHNALTQDAITDLTGYALALQNVTAFTDTQIIAVEAQLATFGLTGEALKKATKATLDMEAAGYDLTTVTTALGKAFQGNATSFQRFGLIIDDTVPVTEKFNAALNKINQNFGGLANAQLLTFSGTLTQVQGKFSNLEDEIGSIFEPLVKNLVILVGNIVDSFRNLSPEMRTWILVLGTAAVSLTGFMAVLATLAALAPTIGLAFGAMFGPIGLAVEGISLLITTLLLFKNVTVEVANIIGQTFQGVVANFSLVVQALVQAAHGEITEAWATISNAAWDTFTTIGTGIESAYTATVTGVKKQVDAWKSMANQKNDIFKADTLNFKNNSQAQTDFEAQQNKLRAQAFLESAQRRVDVANVMFGQLRTIAGSSAQAVFYIDKAAAIASAIVNTARGYTLALASAPPPFNIALANLVGALGAVQIGIIAGTAFAPMAQGGIVMPTSGGTIARIGEAGSREAVIPLNDSEGTRQIREALGGGTTTININAGVIVADDESIRELTKRIDEKLFELRANRESVSF